MTAQSNGDKLITIFGGSGFLGRHVVQALAKQRYRIRVAVRRPDLAGHLQLLGCVGPHLERIHEDAAVREQDLTQLCQIAATYPSRERFHLSHAVGLTRPGRI
jgi:nucleoside-diphosphate-sugar epimerase